MKIFLIVRSFNYWDDYEWFVKAFTSEEKANKFVVDLTAESARVNKEIKEARDKFNKRTKLGRERRNKLVQEYEELQWSKCKDSKMAEKAAKVKKVLDKAIDRIGKQYLKFLDEMKKVKESNKLDPGTEGAYYEVHELELVE